MQQLIIDFMSQYGYLAIFLLVAAENIFPPIPSEVILTFGGFLITTTNLSFLGVVLAATLGATFGALLLYGLGYLLKKETVENLLDGKIGALLGFKKTDVDKAYGWFNRKGAITVLFTRCIPVVRSLISIPAGMSRMAAVPFTLYTLIGTAIWNVLLVYIGFTAGANWEAAANSADGFTSLMTYLVIAVILALVAYFIFKQVKKAKVLAED